MGRGLRTPSWEYRAPMAELGYRRRTSLSEALDEVLNRGAVMVGEARIGLADVDLIYLGLNLVLASVETLEETDRGGGESSLVVHPYPSPLPEREGTGDAGGSRSLAPLPLGEAGRRPGGRRTGEGEQPSTAILPGFQGLVSPEGPTEERDAARGLAQLVLSLVELLRQLIERQAVRRMEGGRLSDQEVERMGLALMELEAKMVELREVFGLTEEDVNLDLGPLGRLLE